MFFKKGLSEAQQQCLRWTLRVSYRDQKSTAGLPHVPSVTLCLNGVCTLEITFYASCAEDIRKTCCSMRRMAKCLVCVIGRVGFGGQGVGRLCLPFCKSTPLCVKSVLFVLCYLSMSLCLYVCITSFKKNSTSTLYHCISLIFTVECICFLSTNQGIPPFFSSLISANIHVSYEHTSHYRSLLALTHVYNMSLKLFSSLLSFHIKPRLVFLKSTSR